MKRSVKSLRCRYRKKTQRHADEDILLRSLMGKSRLGNSTKALKIKLQNIMALLDILADNEHRFESEIQGTVLEETKKIPEYRDFGKWFDTAMKYTFGLINGIESSNLYCMELLDTFEEAGGVSWENLEEIEKSVRKLIKGSRYLFSRRQGIIHKLRLIADSIVLGKEDYQGTIESPTVADTLVQNAIDCLFLIKNIKTEVSGVV